MNECVFCGYFKRKVDELVSLNEYYSSEMDRLKEQTPAFYMYICTTDWTCEMENDYVKMFTSVEQLKKAKPCWEECGITKIKVTALEPYIDPIQEN